ncbi:MAG: type II toxin-antitoxin system HicB family antitoxin [Acidobacteria bacterium]|nr:type II toxin-antitoxin system HicB family antitoxin [Acidobacteriota bacterium]
MGIHKETITAREYSYTVVFEPAEEGGYTVTCPALPGLVTEGDTLEASRAMAVDAIRCYLESMEKDGLPIPSEEDETEPLREKITVQLMKV